MHREKASKPVRKRRATIEERNAITKRLDAVIRLLYENMAASHDKRRFTRNELVHFLHTVDLADTEIGYIIGQPRKEVASLRTKMSKVKSIARVEK